MGQKTLIVKFGEMESNIIGGVGWQIVLFGCYPRGNCLEVNWVLIDILGPAFKCISGVGVDIIRLFIDGIASTGPLTAGRSFLIVIQTLPPMLGELGRLAQHHHGKMLLSFEGNKGDSQLGDLKRVTST